MKDDWILEGLTYDPARRTGIVWRPPSARRLGPVASVALSLVLGGCSIGYGTSGPVVKTPTPRPAAAAQPAGPAAPTSSRAHEAELALQVKRGSCAFLPVFDSLRQGNTSYTAAESALLMELYGSAPADVRDAAKSYRTAQSALTRMEPPASLTQVQLLLQSAADQYLSATDTFGADLAKHKFSVVPTHLGAYKRAQSLMNGATSELHRQEARVNVSTAGACPGYVPASQNEFDMSQLNFTTGTSARLAPTPTVVVASSAPSLAFVAPTSTGRSSTFVVVSGSIHATRHAHSHATKHLHASHRASAPAGHPTPTAGQTLPASRPKPVRALVTYIRHQDLGLTRLLDASDALSAAIQDLQHNFVSDAAVQLKAAGNALRSEQKRLHRQRPPSSNLRLVREREHRAIKAYVNAYGWASRALMGERLMGITIPRPNAEAPVIEYRPDVGMYLRAARNGMQRAGVRWHKARGLLHTIKP